MDIQALATILITVVQVFLKAEPAVQTAAVNLYNTVIKGQEPSPAQIKAIMDAIHAERPDLLPATAGATVPVPASDA